MKKTRRSVCTITWLLRTSASYHANRWRPS